MTDGPGALAGVVTVSRETERRLIIYVDLLRAWQKAQNLVAPATLTEVWRRHIADSAQLAVLFPEARCWIDLGSGGGLPGLVLAAQLAETDGGRVHLVESNRRKCAFLRTAIREMDVPAEVHEGRAEAVLQDWTQPVDRVTARALASLDKLFELSENLFSRDVPAAFPKGQDFVREIDETSKSWVFDLVKHESRLGGGSVILDVSRVRRRSRHG